VSVHGSLRVPQCASGTGAGSSVAAHNQPLRLQASKINPTFGQRFRLSAMEFTGRQEIKRKQIGSALDNSAVEAG
jgi:hypothetical protein